MNIEVTQMITVESKRGMLNIELLDKAGQLHAIIIDPAEFRQIVWSAMAHKAITAEQIGLTINKNANSGLVR